MGLKVGQKVFVMKVGNAARSYKNNPERLIEEDEISKVGNKYFYLKGFEGYGRKTQFCKENFINVSQCSADYRIYLSMQEIEDEREYGIKLDSIIKKIGQYGSTNFSLEQIRKIHDILFTEDRKI